MSPHPSLFHGALTEQEFPLVTVVLRQAGVLEGVGDNILDLYRHTPHPYVRGLVYEAAATTCWMSALGRPPGSFAYDPSGLHFVH